MLRVRVKSKPMFKPQLLPYARLTHILGLHDLAFIYFLARSVKQSVTFYNEVSISTDLKLLYQCIYVRSRKWGTLAPTLAHWHIDNPHRRQPREQIVLLRQNADEFSHIYEQDCYSNLFTILKGQFDTLYVTFVLVVQYGYVVQQL